MNAERSNHNRTIDLRSRTRAFAIRVIRLAEALPVNRASDIVARQVIKSGTSIGANYREASRASSKRHFTTILEIVQREADETIYWLEIVVEAELLPRSRVEPLMKEANEILAMVTASILTAKRQTDG